MQLYRKGSHTLYDLKYHIVWATKYSKPILTERRGKHVRDLIREICLTHNVQILKGHVSKDHIHIFISMPPQISVSKIAQLIKGKTSRKLLQEDKALSKQYWGNHLWARGYFATTSRQITDEMILEYITNQDEDVDKRGDDFTVLSA
ncbi:IS200/IS605 family transposase [Polaribacter porphyrae]|uniref:IS200/IS605 family transposase n=1 Tax=Polaribacter porphyrae TaxID=1137780 RepID=A0A2S7WT85_9FLAO|nr:IS200/IS605 family transposase [Polaribacter porphyrae]PQJ80676.1 IS200/IS605 family transposase [Polaribacter porphyrae]